MKAILLTFKTPKGTEAYARVDAAGKKQRWRDKKISKALAEDTIISQDPLIVRIKIKIPWLAVRINFDKQIIDALSKFGAVLDEDYKLEILR